MRKGGNDAHDDYVLQKGFIANTGRGKFKGIKLVDPLLAVTEEARNKVGEVETKRVRVAEGIG